MDAAGLRQVLAAFLGIERYRMFVKHLSYGQRMRYWQERSWSQFILAHPEFAVSEEELRVALRGCWVHGIELQPETVKVVDEVADYAGYSIRTENESYPCAEATSILWAEGCPFPARTEVVWYCTQCRVVYESDHPGARRTVDWSRLSEEGTET
jgi:hypothetical protein